MAAAVLHVVNFPFPPSLICRCSVLVVVVASPRRDIVRLLRIRLLARCCYWLIGLGRLPIPHLLVLV